MRVWCVGCMYGVCVCEYVCVWGVCAVCVCMCGVCVCVCVCVLPTRLAIFIVFRKHSNVVIARILF